MGLCFLSMEAEITEGKGEGHAEPKFIPALCCSVSAAQKRGR